MTPSPDRETILVAEDEAVVQKLLLELLRREGYATLAADDGAAALELARNHAGPLDLLITDVVMPKMAGTDLARQIAELKPGIRILLISGYSNPDAVAPLQNLAGVAYLRKPFLPRTLLAQVRALLDA
ncbi:MAG: response regulator [Terriglobales bacterium]